MSEDAKLLERLKRYEGLHVFCWLIKDSCWMLEFKLLGTVMIVPTVLLALYFLVAGWGTPDIYLHGAIFCWITANSFWMLMEFFNHEQLKHFSGIPFFLGIASIVGYFFATRKKSQQ
jgi:hypothetical protein